MPDMPFFWPILCSISELIRRDFLRPQSTPQIVYRLDVNPSSAETRIDRRTDGQALIFERRGDYATAGITWAESHPGPAAEGLIRTGLVDPMSPCHRDPVNDRHHQQAITQKLRQLRDSRPLHLTFYF